MKVIRIQKSEKESFRAIRKEKDIKASQYQEAIRPLSLLREITRKGSIIL